MQIESGKYYKRRDGRVVGPAEWCNEYDGYWRLDGNHYKHDGQNAYLGGCYGDKGQDYKDLIAPSYPETGTLQEIGANVGDVVLYVGDDATPSNDERKISGIHENGNTYHDGQVWGGWQSLNEKGPWKIISRAPETKPSPVREVTRKEIVAGEYGRVVVTDASGVWVRDCFTATELTEAITTLTEIRDAMVQE